MDVEDDVKAAWSVVDGDEGMLKASWVKFQFIIHLIRFPIVRLGKQ